MRIPRLGGLTRPALLVIGATALAAGCAGRYRGAAVVSSGYPAGYYEPDLIYVSPGVYAVADYDVPVFYSANFYWRYDDRGRWYRSRYFDRGWGYARPPEVIARIDRPYRYRFYRGEIARGERQRTYDRQQGGRYYRDRDGRVRIRDHRR